MTVASCLTTSWLLNADGYGVNSFEDQLNSLLEVVRSQPSNFRKLSADWRFAIGVMMEFNRQPTASLPWAGLDKSQLALMHEYGIELDFDFYLG